MIIHIVEDDAAVADALAIALEAQDHRPMTYRDGESFLAEALLTADDWVIVDLGLPGKSGADVVRELLDRPETPGIVAISGKPRTTLLQQIRDLPNLTVLRKPLSIDMVTKALA